MYLPPPDVGCLCFVFPARLYGVWSMVTRDADMAEADYVAPIPIWLWQERFIWNVSFDEESFLETA